MTENTDTNRRGIFVGHALVVAIAGYQHSPPLPPVVLDDARDLAAVLTSPDHCGYEKGNVTVLLDANATREAVLSELGGLADRADRDDTVCIYFSGHGELVGGEDASDSALLTYDGSGGDVEATSISAVDFSDALQRIGASRVVVLLDACHAGGAATLKGTIESPERRTGFSEETLMRLAEGTGRVLMASCRPSEKSLILTGARNSVFTGHLLQGLQGGGASDGRDLIRVFDLFTYVSERVVAATSGRQHPNFKANHVEDNFPVALCPRVHKADVDIWEVLGRVMPDLYPAGPADEGIWIRAGGDLSRLRLQGTGRAAWFMALRTLRQGGGGHGIDAAALLAAAFEDFPGDEDLALATRAASIKGDESQ